MEGQVATFEPEVTQMNGRNRKRLLWAVGAVLAMGAVLGSSVVFADRGEVEFTATMYSDVIRFEADGVASLRLTIYDLAENELWTSGLIPGDSADWDRTSAGGERLANGYYLYLAQGWDTADSLVLSKAGKVVLLPGDQVELKAAPSAGGTPAGPSSNGPVYQPMAYDAADWHVSDSLGVGTDNPQDPLDVHGYIRCYYLREESITPQMRWYETDAADDPNDYMRHEYGGNKYRMQWRDDSAGTWFNALVADGSARAVGIGTTTPGRTLDVSGTGRFTGALTVGSYTLPTADGTNGQVLATNGGGTVSWTTIAGGGSGYWTASGDDISNTNTGTITLKVNEHLFLHDTGNQSVFLGELAGTAIVAGEENHNTAVGYEALRLTTTGSDNTAVGKDALMNNTEGIRNTAMGEEALDQNTTGNWNTAIGAHALIVNTTGTGNTAVGENALDSSALGHDNIAVGHSAGQALATGSDNIYIGHQGQATESGTIRIGNSTDHTAAYLAGVRGVAVTSGEYVVVDANGKLGSTAAAGGGSGYWTASGDDIYSSNSGNVGIGETSPSQKLDVEGNIAMSGYLYQGSSVFLHNAGTNNTFAGASAGNLTLSGADNTAVGFQSLRDDTTGHSNTAIGADALNDNTTGFENTAVGEDALHFNQAGEANTAIGHSALEQSTDDYNTAVGYHALNGLTDGSHNIALGNQAGSNLTDGDKNIFIGASGAAATESNTIRIGNSSDHSRTYLQGPVTIENYTLPDTDGTNGQVLSTNGSGTVSWQTVAGGSSAWTTSGDHIYSSNSGNVGIGDTTPSQKLDVDGNIEMNGMLFMGADRFLFTRTGHSLFLGVNSGNETMSGNYNVGIGRDTLSSVTSGVDNVALGWGAQHLNASGYYNTAVGDCALYYNSAGDYNTAVGNDALKDLAGTNSCNTAVGNAALSALASGSGNIALGHSAGSANTGGADNIYIGNVGAVETATIRIGGPAQTSAYMAGIYGGTVSGGTAVYIKSDGQLGTTTSSARFKTGIADLGSTSDVLYDLRPVTFEYKPEIDPLGITQYGLIAEEVAEVAPDLVIYDDAGDPYTVRYEQLVPLLLNELQEKDAEIDELRGLIEGLDTRLVELESASHR